METFNNNGQLYVRKVYDTDFIIEIPAVLNEDGSLNESQTTTNLDTTYEIHKVNKETYETYTS
jgi:hypothetical protein